MTSLRKRLFLILVAATGAIWLSAVVWIYVGAKAEVEKVLDTRLQEAARMVSSLVGSGDVAASRAIAAVPGLSPETASYERQLSCQVWSLDGRLVARSSGAPDVRLAENASGFSDRVVEGETWRVYAVENAATGVRVMVGDRLGLRERLVADLIKGLIAPAFLIVPLLGLLIWVSLGRGLRPLNAMADQLQVRAADDMSPIRVGNVPVEVMPLARSLNELFAKVELARRHERDVTAFAAHELRTPLAGLKTQAQIAIAATDPAMKEGALRQILVSVDRTTRLVRQLLAIAKLDAQEAAPDGEQVIVGDLLDEIIAALKPSNTAIHVDVEPALHSFRVRANREILSLALRNLHENALQHMPSGGTASWRVSQDGQGVTVEDEGPGIPDDELQLVTQRFFRGRHKTAAGTGLGLAIVAIAIERLGARFSLQNREGGSGVSATINFEETRRAEEDAPAGP